MAKNNKKGPKSNVFKVAGAKSLKKTKAKAVNLGLKNVSFITRTFIKQPYLNVVIELSLVNQHAILLSALHIGYLFVCVLVDHCYCVV